MTKLLLNNQSQDKYYRYNFLNNEKNTYGGLDEISGKWLAVIVEAGSFPVDHDAVSLYDTHNQKKPDQPSNKLYEEIEA